MTNNPCWTITNWMVKAGQSCPFRDETLTVILNGDLSQETITILSIHALGKVQHLSSKKYLIYLDINKSTVVFSGNPKNKYKLNIFSHFLFTKSCDYSSPWPSNFCFSLSRMVSGYQAFLLSEVICRFLKIISHTYVNGF